MKFILSNPIRCPIALFALLTPPSSWAAPGSLVNIHQIPGFLSASSANCFVQQDDGVLVVAGTQSTGSWQHDFLISGSFIAQTNFGGELASDDYANCIAIQSDGKAILAGSTSLGGSFALLRYNLDGTLDASFDGDGKVITPIPTGVGGVNGIAIQGDGKILAIGPFLARYNANGSLDTGFNSTGIRTDISGENVVIQPDQKFIVGNPLRRFNPDGSPDTSFNGTGTASQAVIDAAGAPFLQKDGKILLARSTGNGWQLARCNADGTLDGAFGVGGTVITQLPGQVEIGRSVAFQRDWRIVVAGTVSNFSQGIESLALARYNYGGSLDTSFGDGGKVITTLGNTKAGAKDAIVLSNGQIAVLGWVYTAGNGAPAVIARFEGGPNPEITVEGPAGTPLNDGDAASTAFPPVVLGNSASLVFTIRNQGEAELIVPTITKSPTGTPGDFSIGTLGATSLAPGVSTTFTVSFSPTAPGVRTATVLIASNDEDENPFEINLTGSMATALEAWRQTYFGSPYDAGPGADLNDADGDGIVNLIEFATASDPTAPTLAPGQLVKNGTTLEFTYIRRKDALGEVSFVREYSVTLNGTWSRTGSTVETILSDDGTLQTVRVNTPAGSTGKRFVRLRVTRL